jgi:cytochrome c oxidase subunit IV
MRNLIIAVIIVGTLIWGANVIVGSFMNMTTERTSKINTIIDKLN